jgi:hypothetical protein
LIRSGVDTIVYRRHPLARSIAAIPVPGEKFSHQIDADLAIADHAVGVRMADKKGLERQTFGLGNPFFFVDN